MTDDKFISIVIVGIIIVVIILVAILVVLTLKEKMKKKEIKTTDIANLTEEEEKKAKKSIFKFMEFDKVEDNMIIQDDGKRFLMVIECKGINYDLLSGVEKTSVEQGFLQFLNTLKFEIQLYIQTRKVNLAQSTMNYRDRLKLIEQDMRNQEARYEDMQRSGNYTREEILKQIKEVTKKRNLYEYGKDIIENTEQMSQDTDLTTKEYYIVVPYYTEEITSAGEFDKKEISSMAFSELYTRAQSLVSALTECDVRGKILNSQELIELLYIAFNREQHDIYDFDSYMSQSGFNSFYSVSEDVFEKRIQALDEEIAKKANEKALEAYMITSKKVADAKRKIAERETNMQEYIDTLAKDILDAESVNIGTFLSENAKIEVSKMTEEATKTKQKKTNEEEENFKKISSESVQKTTKKKVLTEEERIRRKKILLKKKKLQMEKEAQKNGDKQV